jgi:hypothetical protein
MGLISKHCPLFYLNLLTVCATGTPKQSDGSKVRTNINEYERVDSFSVIESDVRSR